MDIVQARFAAMDLQLRLHNSASVPKFLKPTAVVRLYEHICRCGTGICGVSRGNH
jgi:hypothetical protein